MSFQVIPMPAKTLAWWRDEVADIDLEPIYQRKGHVWSDTQKQFLIDSILNGFDVPKLYVADFTFLNSELNAHRKKYAVIDGKQRLQAILEFFDDRLTLARNFVYVEDPTLRLGGYSYSDLVKNHPRIARRFDNYSLTVMSVITDDESMINDLFVRLNSSKPLTGAEVRNAMGGRLPTIIRDLTLHTFFQTKIRFSTARSQDRNTAAKLLLLEHRGSIVDTKKSQLDALVREVEDTDSEGAADELEVAVENALVDAAEETENIEIERSAARVSKVLDILSEIFVDRDELLSQQAQVVVIYWVVRSLDFGLIGKFRPFLLDFANQRRSSRIGEYGIADAEISDYELMSRTSNDAASIRRRAKILQDRFASYVKIHD